MFKIKSSDKYYLIFKYFWVIAILPKSVQLVVFFLITLYLTGGKISIAKDHFFTFQLLHIVVFALAIIASLIRFPHEANRVFAAVNTFGITVFALLLYNIYADVELDLARVGKYCCLSTVVMLGILLLYVFFPDKRGLSVFGYSLGSIDYGYIPSILENPDGGLTTRFVGFLSYSNLIPVFSALMMPLSLLYLNKKKVIWAAFQFILAFAFSWYAHSRSGQLVILMEIALILFFCVLVLFRKRDRVRFYVLTVLLVLVMLLLAFPIVAGKLSNMLGQREGSNSMRFYIYRSSISRMWNESPLIGMGIKDMLGALGYPYGSHSSYIGYLYKTGLLGGLFYVISLAVLSLQIIKWKQKKLTDYVMISSIIAVAVWMVLEDLDGANWPICLCYACLGMIRYRMKQNRTAHESRPVNSL